ncbi:MAG: DNA cytosine methyltransferase [Chloroflexaceae bacterium]|nr:DNA cytosine methyltransferase [Chloroflexaceae bacterium]NJL55458.1 DNA cytosine methyltransferase [bacterium]
MTHERIDIPRDANGIYRSAKLPSRRGEFIRLAPRLQTQDGLEQWQARVDDPDTIIVLDLFCGAGGMSLGTDVPAVR